MIFTIFFKKVLELPNIIFGGIDTNFLHAKKTEKVLLDKSIIKNLRSTLKEALDTLHGEVYPNHVLPDYSPKFRKILAEGLFYRFILNINLNKPNNISPFYHSGGTLLERGLSSGIHKISRMFMKIYIHYKYLSRFMRLIYL